MKLEENIWLVFDMQNYNLQCFSSGMGVGVRGESGLIGKKRAADRAIFGSVTV